MQCKMVYIASIFALLFSTAFAQHCNGGVDCIMLNNCAGLYSQLQRGNTAQLTRLLRSLHCGFDGEHPMICCPPEFRYVQEVTERGGGAGAFTNSNQDEWSQDRNEDRGPVSERVNPVPRGGASLLPDAGKCGVQNNDRIVGGTQADIDEHPWMALLRYDKPYGWGFYCGGVLISARYILTAAHCVKGQDLPPNWRLSQVRLGEWNTSSARDCVADDCAAPPQDVPVEEIIAHESYDPADSNQHNDIALLRLSRNVKYNGFVQPICLPLSDELKQSTFDGSTMEVAGWGKTESRSESDVKLKVQVPVVNRNECANVFSRVGRQVVSRQLCAGGNAGQDSCRGDSGGALMGRTSSQQTWFAAGVVSYGPSPCGTPGWPGVYTRVGAYVDWILSQLKP